MKKISLTLAILFAAIAVFAQPTTFQKGEFISKSTGDTLLYRYLVPENIQKGKKYPLVIFLHGSGERGNDNKAQLFHGSGQFINPVNREKYPAFVLFPQCPEGVPGA
ncbi:MAG: phospholipase, partial [Bacteroidales bacterium]|nr:phospholipase [Bacteroidales bacterium]